MPARKHSTARTKKRNPETNIETIVTNRTLILAGIIAAAMLAAMYMLIAANHSDLIAPTLATFGGVATTIAGVMKCVATGRDRT